MRKLNACSKCRAFFEIDQTVCPSCGTSIVPRMVREKGGIFDRLAGRGANAVNLLVVANLLVFIVAAIMQGGLIMEGGIFGMGGLHTKTLLALGAGNWQDVARDGEWYRLVCPMFLHVNFVHILFNLMALRAVGPLAEKFLGSAKFLTVYLLAGLAGSAVSSYWNAPYGLGVGASGAVFGVIGVAAVIGYRIGNRDLAYAMLRWIVIMLVIGFAMPLIDNAAHLGGLGAGVFLAFRVRAGSATRLSVAAVRFWDVSALVGVVVVLASFGMAVTGGQ